MKDYIVSIAISDEFLNGDLRLNHFEIKSMIVKELSKFKYRQVCKNLFEVTAPIEDAIVLYKTLINATYSKEEGRNLFDMEIDVIYIMPLDRVRCINGEYFGKINYSTCK